jgi:hypothetical protein
VESLQFLEVFENRTLQMDWILMVLILTSGPTFAQSHSHEFVLFSSEKLCEDAAKAVSEQLGRPTESGIKVEVRTVCAQRKAAK